MSHQTLHLQFSERDRTSVELRLWTTSPNHYHSLVLSPGDLEEIIRLAETDYYVPLPGERTRFGKTLYQWLNRDGRFARELEALRGAPHPVMLAFDCAGHLAHLPWELLHDGDQFLVTRRNPEILPVRWKDLPGGGDPEPANRPLNLLFMACAPEEGGSELDFEAEEGRILEATRHQPMNLVVEESGDLTELRSLVVDYGESFFDVVHLTGHAGHGSDGPVFLTETETGERHEAAPVEIGDALPPPPPAGLPLRLPHRRGRPGRGPPIPRGVPPRPRLPAGAGLGAPGPGLRSDPRRRHPLSRAGPGPRSSAGPPGRLSRSARR